MNFTDRFIKVPIRVYSSVLKELTGKEEYEHSWFKFLPFELAGYRPESSDDRTIVDDQTTLILKCGDITVANINIDEFEKLLNNHDKNK